MTSTPIVGISINSDGLYIVTQNSDTIPVEIEIGALGKGRIRISEDDLETLKRLIAAYDFVKNGKVKE